jgi:hypothetical protein
MTFLPIVERELRVRARRKSTYRFRLVAALTAILLVTLLLIASMGSGTAGGSGQGVFRILTWLCFLYCLAEGPKSTSDALSQEKREGTLGLLFLTDLRGYDIVFGKLAATSLSGAYGLLAVFPPLAIPLVLGGVTGGEFLRTILALLNALFFSLCCGLCISSGSRDERTTWAYSSIVVALLTIVPPFLLLIPGTGTSIIGSMSPTTALLMSDDRRFLASPETYRNSLLLIHGLGWIALIIAGIRLPHGWQDRGGTVSRGRKTDGTIRDRKEHRQRARLLDSQPVTWLALRQLHSNGLLWALVSAASIVLLVSWSLSQGNTVVALVLLTAMYVLHLTLAVWLASEACHFFASARDSGALELLLSTPLNVREIILGHSLGLRRLFLRPVAALIGVEIITTVSHLYVQGSSGTSLIACFLIAAAVLFFLFVSVLDLQAVATYGMWMGLINKRPARAVTLTVLHVLLLPMLGVIFLPLYPVLAMVKNLVFINYGQEQLRRHFRTAVTDRFGPSTAEWVTVAQPLLPNKPLPRVMGR